MRIVLTVIAILFITVLTAALVAPPFIDWSAERPRIEAELAKRLGVELSISGPLTVRLLPTPYIEVAHVEIGPHDAPVFVCDGARLELAITSLASARARFSAIELQRPTLSLDLEALPRPVALPRSSPAPASTSSSCAAGAQLQTRRGGADRARQRRLRRLRALARRAVPRRRRGDDGRWPARRLRIRLDRDRQRRAADQARGRGRKRWRGLEEPVRRRAEPKGGALASKGRLRFPERLPRSTSAALRRGRFPARSAPIPAPRGSRT